MPWVLPTYDRPDRCRNTLDSINSAGCTTPGVVIVQGTDRRAEYARLEQFLPAKWRMVFGQTNIGVCAALNRFFSAYPSEPWYGVICDDELIGTPGWDSELVNAAGRWSISNANDGWQAEQRIHTFAVYGGELLRALGTWAAPACWHCFGLDVLWELLDSEFGLRKFCRHIISEHRHWHARTAARDRAYVEAESRYQADAAAWRTWLEDEFPALRERFAAAIAAARATPAAAA